MSNMSDALASALSVISTFEGVTLGYRTGVSGSFTALTGWAIHKDRVPQSQYDERTGGDIQIHSMMVKGPLSPAMVKGYQIQVGGSATDIWAVESVTTHAQQICLCRRAPVATLGPDRGGTR